MADAPATVPPEPAVDDNMETKKNIWQRWGRRQDWANELEKKAAYRALDMPEDDTNITKTQTTTNSGAGGGAIAAAALAGGIPATILAAMLGMSALKGGASTPPIVTPTPTPTATSVSAEASLYKQNADGSYTRVDLPTLPSNAKVTN